MLVETNPASALALATRVQDSLTEHPESSTPAEHLDTALTRARSLSALSRIDEAREVAAAALAEQLRRRGDARPEYTRLASWAEDNGLTPPLGPTVPEG